MQLGQEDANSTEELMFSFSGACVPGSAPFLSLIKERFFIRAGVFLSELHRLDPPLLRCPILF